MIIREIGNYLSNILPADLLAENRRHTPMLEDGLRFGDDSADVTGVMVCWMATVEAIKKAVDKGCNVVICHEDPYFQSIGVFPELSAGWFANRQRLHLLIEHNITLYRCHSPLDVLFTVDASLEQMDLHPKDIYCDWIARVAKVEPITIRELMDKARDGFEVDHIRYVGDMDRVVTRVGFSVGGMGLSVNGSFQEMLRLGGAEVILTGEFDDYSAFWACESGIAMIAVGHSVCENPGIRRFEQKLRADFPDLKVLYHECKLPYHMY